MATTVGTETSLSKLVENLIHLEYDAIAAYEAAVDRLDDGALKERMSGFLSDHQGHVRALSEVSRDLGETPPTGGDAKQMLIKGKVVLADMAGDKAILHAMKTNEDDTNTAYERAGSHADATPAAKTMFEGALADERRHKAWIEETVARL